ncbi:MAG TPA: DUF998 domain-containing protein [Pseudonocardiaceae bacterium]|nr:DUF998 domain-containing protein [Pseudonocardiaceae bacterium]
MSVTTTPRSALVHSYLFMRRAIGLIGMALPVVLIVGNLIWPPGLLLDSISNAYYTPLRGVFVGSMSALGVFLVSYRGYGAVDDITGDVAGIGAIGLALFPTTPNTGATSGQVVVGDLHTAFAGVFFLALVFFCLFLFPRTIPGVRPLARKRQRNVVYRVTGVLIFVSIVLIGIVKFTSVAASLHPMLWLETIAILAFGVAWAVKGETLGVLRDRSA